MAITILQVQDAAFRVGVSLTELQAAQLVRFRDLLVEWNARFNLTAITDDAAILTRHFADSLTVLRVIDQEPQNEAHSVPPLARSGFTLLDVGSGAGLPGIPLKIARPGLDMTLMDSTGKKVAFCQAVISDLQLTGLRTVQGRAEEAARQAPYRERFDAVIARAVAPLPTLVEYLLPFARLGGLCVAMKGSDARAEAAQAARAIRILGGELQAVQDVTLPGLPDRRALVVIRKARPTPPAYPRQGGKPRRSPLVG